MNDLKNRILIIIIGLPIFIILFNLKINFMIHVGILMMGLSWSIFYELSHLQKKGGKKISPVNFVVYSLEIALFYIIYIIFRILKLPDNRFYFIFFLLFSFILHSLFSIFEKDMSQAFSGFLHSFFFLWYSILTPFLIYFLYLNYQNPFLKLLFFLLIIWISNSSGYLVGMSVKNRHALKLPASPNKSAEGFAGALILGTILPYLLWIFIFHSYFEKSVSIPFLILFIFIINLACIVGDLFESMIKRFFNQKDSSSLFKGHGGILDMVDSIIFAFPIFYIIFLQISF